LERREMTENERAELLAQLADEAASMALADALEGPGGNSGDADYAALRLERQPMTMRKHLAERARWRLVMRRAKASRARRQLRRPVWFENGDITF
jgi:NAD(P)H-hydrate repair Nnr-like enzyme with NAD(P)H-hydrate epimerase domain